MLQKKYRLKKNIEFVATYAQKKYVSNTYLTLNLGKPKPFEDFISKVAFVVSKKILSAFVLGLVSNNLNRCKNPCRI